MTTLAGDRAAFPSPRTALYSASIAQGAVSFVALGLPAIGPQLRQEFGLSLAELGAVLTAILVGSGIAFLAIGAALDRFGARATTTFGTAVAVSAMCGAAYAPTGGILIGALLISGAGLGVVPIAGGAGIFATYPTARRARAMGIRQMSAPLGGMAGAALMPALYAVGGSRLIFFVGAAVAGTSSMGLALCSSTATQRTRRPQPLREIWNAPGIRRLLFATCFYIAVLQAVLSYTVPAVRGSGFSALVAGTTYFVVNLTAAVSRVVFGRRADRGGGTRRRRTLIESGVVAGVGAIVFAFALHASVIAILPAAVVLALGASGWNAVVYTFAGELTRPELAARAFALSATVVSASTGIVTPLLGELATHAGWNGLWAATAFCAICAAAVISTLPRAPHPAAP